MGGERGQLRKEGGRHQRRCLHVDLHPLLLGRRGGVGLRLLGRGDWGFLRCRRFFFQLLRLFFSAQAGCLGLLGLLLRLLLLEQGFAGLGRLRLAQLGRGGASGRGLLQPGLLLGERLLALLSRPLALLPRALRFFRPLGRRQLSGRSDLLGRCGLGVELRVGGGISVRHRCAFPFGVGFGLLLFPLRGRRTGPRGVGARPLLA